MSIGTDLSGTDDALTPEERAMADRIARAAPSGAPSPALDARILAAARAAVQSPQVDAAPAPSRPPARRRQRRWPTLVGVAATLVIAVGVAWQLRPIDDTTSSYSEAPRRAPAARASGPQAADAFEQDAVVASDKSASQPVAAQGIAPPTVEPPAASATAVAPASVETVSAIQADPERKKASDAVAKPGGSAATQAGTLDRADVMSAPSPEAFSSRREPSLPVPASAPAPAPPPPPAPAKPMPMQTPVMPQAVAPMEPESATSAGHGRAARITSQEAGSAKQHQPEPSAISANAAAEADAAAESTSSKAFREVDDGRARGDASGFGDQPVDDQPPASADSPRVRDAWLKRVRTLLTDGDRDAARASLLEYQRRYPDSAIPDDLRPLLAK